ncbi:carbonic anhydrase [Mastigocladopsis repens]|uniref:carbonic anhydrase n=1 Tax=Mastigocladopsis repens TaxID=221287 RepID=UPI0002E95584|nr:carbonic anhydrase family protein [Mastigocladopsis repens]
MVTTSDQQSIFCDPNYSEPIWSYDDSSGPDNWAELNPDYQKCDQGQKQSPININTKEIVRTPWNGTLQFQYSCPDLKLKNTGREIEIECCDRSNKLVIAQQEYELKEFHFHTPSEHAVDLHAYPVEIHLVHEKVGNPSKLVVVAVFINQGEENSFLELIASNLPEQPGCEIKVSNSDVSVLNLLPKTHGLYYYSGSLTTPPCSENVHWIVFKETVFASVSQISRLSSVFPFFNTRPVQPTNSRLVRLIVSNEQSGDNNGN